MRVIAGELKGRRLSAVPGRSVRPTSDRVRESIFSILGQRPAGAHALDLFAGTGTMGIEALSRGATLAIFIERSPRAVRALRANLDRLGLERRSKVWSVSVVSGLDRLHRQGASFELVFLDPPYLRGLAERTLSMLSQSEVVRYGGLVVAEHHEREKLPRSPGGLVFVGERRFGDTQVSFYERVAPPTPPRP